jgi:hypothetical protein
MYAFWATAGTGATSHATASAVTTAIVCRDVMFPCDFILDLSRELSVSSTLLANADEVIK